MQVKPAWHAHTDSAGYPLQNSAKRKRKHRKREQNFAKERERKERECLNQEDNCWLGFGRAHIGTYSVPSPLVWIAAQGPSSKQLDKYGELNHTMRRNTRHRQKETKPGELSCWVSRIDVPIQPCEFCFLFLFLFSWLWPFRAVALYFSSISMKRALSCVVPSKKH